MLVGQQLGPFAIDKELGAGAMGAVYRGHYTKTGQVVAVKVMAPGLGSTSPSATARFEREAEILKQLRHPNIVGLFGVGKSQGVRYLAMEYIQGESLDKMMARRGRLSWEEVVELGKQLCAALQHAHEKGIVHRDLKPANLMVLPDGTLKLTDFGIAKDLDVTQLTSANCTVGTAAYMSPEQCKGERDLTFKSDLYSLGVVLYELLTGVKPFQAENVMDMFMLHVQGTFVRPAQLVLDIPVWLDNLVCQLLEKKPEHRPRDAAMVAEVLETIREKVEAQQSAGVEAAHGRAIDRPGAAHAVEEKDREAASALRGGKGRKKARHRKRPFYRRVWFRALGLAALLGGVVTVLYLVFRPPPADTLYAQAEGLMKSAQPEDHDRALEGPIADYLAHYKDRPGPQTDQVRRWADQVEAEHSDDKLQRFLRKHRQGKDSQFPPQSDTEKKAFEAAADEDDGKMDEARRDWQEVAQGGERGWAPLARQHLQALDALGPRERALHDLLANDVDVLNREPQVQGPDQQALTALRYEYLGEVLSKPEPGDLAGALTHWRELKEKTGADLAQRPWYLLAACKVRELEGKLPPRQDAEEHRKELVGRAVAEIKDRVAARNDPVRAKALTLHLVALYGDDPKLKPLVQEAGETLKGLAGKR
jgi:serine/threonine-protein kinase